MISRCTGGPLLYAGAYALHAAAREFNDAVKQAIAVRETELPGLDGFMARLRDEMRLALEAQGRFLEEHGIATSTAADGDARARTKTEPT